MPMRKDAYPKDWKEISLRIRERAGNKCEWCGAPNHAHIRRRKSNPFEYEMALKDECGDKQWADAIRVVLTVHHVGAAYPDGSPGNPHDKMDCRDENLVALCQRCHLLADREFHKANRRRTMARKKTERMAEIGQRELL